MSAAAASSQLHPQCLHLYNQHQVNVRPLPSCFTGPARHWLPASALTAPLAPRSLEAYSSLMNEAAELLMRNLAAAAKARRPVDIHRLLGDMTMQVVGTTAFGCARRLPCSVAFEECG